MAETLSPFVPNVRVASMMSTGSGTTDAEGVLATYSRETPDARRERRERDCGAVFPIL